VPNGGIGGPGGSGAHGSHHVFGAETDFSCRSQQALRLSLPPAPYSLPSRATPGLSRNQISRLSLTALLIANGDADPCI